MEIRFAVGGLSQKRVNGYKSLRQDLTLNLVAPTNPTTTLAMSEELKGLNQWLQAEGNTSDSEQLKKLWSITSSYKCNTWSDPEAAFERFRQNKDFISSKRVEGDFRRVRFLRVAAAVLLLFASAYLVKTVLFSSSVAMLTEVTDSQTIKVVSLPDESVVTLNKNSQLIYPKEFDNKERRVRLTGEAYFEVEASKERPFLVETSFGQVRVLGTKFNVKALPNSNTLEVYVKEGRVTVKPNGDKFYQLDASSLLVYDQSASKIYLTRKLNENELAWKTGKLSFQNEPISEVVRAVEKIFGLKVFFENQDLANCPVYFNVNIEKLQNIWTVLEATCPGIDIEQVNEKNFILHGHCCN